MYAVIAEHSKNQYEAAGKLLDDNLESVCQIDKKTIIAQMTIHAGIYNRDIEMFKKGFENYKKYTMIRMDFIQDAEGDLTWNNPEGNTKIKAGEAYRTFCEVTKKCYDNYTQKMTALMGLNYF